MCDEMTLYLIGEFIFVIGLIFGAVTNNISLCIEAGSFLIATAIRIEGLRIYRELNK